MLRRVQITIKGEELRRRINEAIREREGKLAALDGRIKAREGDQPDDVRVALEEEWQAEVLAFLRDHIEPEEVYRLGKGDLEFGDLLPEKPGWMKTGGVQGADGPRLRPGADSEKAVEERTANREKQCDNLPYA
jgi:hypothetical protein